MSLRFRICLAAWIAVVLLTALSSNSFAQTLELAPQPTDEQPIEVLPAADSEWIIDIRPAAKVTSAIAAPTVHVAGDESCEACGTAQVNDYTTLYKNIPFNRAEYSVNPSYRHDSAMEILTGNARHQTIVRHNTERQTAAVVARPVPGVGNPYRYGYLRPALRLNYYRYFPSLNPYVNMWNYSGAY